MIWLDPNITREAAYGILIDVFRSTNHTFPLPPVHVLVDFLRTNFSGGGTFRLMCRAVGLQPDDFFPPTAHLDKKRRASCSANVHDLVCDLYERAGLSYLGERMG
jgi:hypothetical protein